MMDSQGSKDSRRSGTSAGGFLLVLLLVGVFLLRADLNEGRDQRDSREGTSWVALEIPGAFQRFCSVREGDLLHGLLAETLPELVTRLPRAALETAIEGGTRVWVEKEVTGTGGFVEVLPLPEGFRFLLGLPLNVNRATAAELCLLPGIGPKLAAKIELTRQERGLFSSFEDLLAVDGIGRALLEKVRGSVCFSSPQGHFFLFTERLS